MQEEDRKELIRLAIRMTTKTAQSATLNGIALNLHGVGETVKAEQKAQLSDNARDEAEKTFQEFIAYLDKL